MPRAPTSRCASFARYNDVGPFADWQQLPIASDDAIQQVLTLANTAAASTVVLLTHRALYAFDTALPTTPPQLLTTTSAPTIGPGCRLTSVVAWTRTRDGGERDRDASTGGLQRRASTSSVMLVLATPRSVSLCALRLSSAPPSLSCLPAVDMDAGGWVFSLAAAHGGGAQQLNVWAATAAGLIFVALDSGGGGNAIPMDAVNVDGVPMTAVAASADGLLVAAGSSVRLWYSFDAAQGVPALFHWCVRRKTAGRTREGKGSAGRLSATMIQSLSSPSPPSRELQVLGGRHC